LCGVGTNEITKDLVIQIFFLSLIDNGGEGSCN
jgi:hypothetical protein